MGRMIRSKKEFKCTQCSRTTIKWEGVCKNCGSGGTLQEIVLRPEQVKAIETEEQRRLRRRAKTSEREIARRMLKVDGEDPAYSKIASSTGRVGHITGMRIDAVSKTYVTENKNRKIPTWMVDAWVLLNQRGKSYNKNILLHLEPPNNPKNFLIEGHSEKLDTMAVITQTRHEELIKAEKVVNELENIIFKDDKYIDLQEIFWRLKS